MLMEKNTEKNIDKAAEKNAGMKAGGHPHPAPLARRRRPWIRGFPGERALWRPLDSKSVDFSGFSGSQDRLSGRKRAARE